jgi:acyl-CoA dehydrogenase
MYLEFTDEQLAVREAVRAFTRSRAPLTYVRSMYEDGRGTTPEVWRGLVDLGVAAILVPEPYGGLGLGMLDMGLVLEELGRALHPGPYFSTAVAATLFIVALDEGIEGDLLSAMAVGDHVVVPALFEPGRRYEWRTPAAAADAVGSEWAVTGTKAHVADARAADSFVVVAAAPDGLGLFVVAAADAEVTPDAVLDGTKKEASVTFRGAPARRIGRGDATRRIEGALDRVLTALAVEATGAAQAALDISVEYAKVRQQFGRPIGAFQAVQQLCVDMHSAVENGRSLAYAALWAADEDDAEECHRAAVMAKAYVSDAVVAVGERAIQVHGGVGVTWDHDIGLYYKRCLSRQTAYGDGDEHYEQLAAILLP